MIRRWRALAGVVAAASLVAPAAPAPAQVGTHPVPLTIDSTGSTDVTEDLLAFIADVPDGSTIVFRPGGRYRIDGSLVIVDRNDLVFDGRGATVFAGSPGDRDRRHWWFHGGSNLVVRDLTMVGAHPEAGIDERAWREDKEFQHGFHVAGVDGFELDLVRVTDVFGDFVYLGKATEGRTKNRRASRVRIQRSHFERNGRQGISVTAADDVLIQGNYIGMTRRATFDFEPPTRTWVVSRVRILNNRIGDGRLLFVASAGQGPVDDILVQGNELDQRPMTVVVDPPEGLRRSRWRFIDNRTNSQHGSPQGSTMRFRQVDGIEVRRNQQPLQERRQMVLVEAYESCDIVVEDNELGPHAIGQVEVHPYDCRRAAPAAPGPGAPVPDGPAPDAPAADGGAGGPSVAGPATTGPAAGQEPSVPEEAPATPAPTPAVPADPGGAIAAPPAADAPADDEAAALGPEEQEDEGVGPAGVVAIALLLGVAIVLGRRIRRELRPPGPTNGSSGPPEVPSSG